MASPRYLESDLAVSLFPFLSVLFGVIGTLSLVIAGMTAIGLQDTDQFVELERDRLTGKTAVYVECRKEGLLLHPEQTELPLDELLDDNGAWARRLDTIKSKSTKEYLVLLVRPNGIESFDAAFVMARLADIDVGFDPVYSAGQIRFR